jgi:hypothetical protein
MFLIQQQSHFPCMGGAAMVDSVAAFGEERTDSVSCHLWPTLLPPADFKKKIV